MKDNLVITHGTHLHNLSKSHFLFDPNKFTSGRSDGSILYFGLDLATNSTSYFSKKSKCYQ